MAKILIVDDSKIMRINLKKIFEELGHTVVAEAGDGNAALEAYEEHSPDLVTMDITMPGMSGIETVEAMMKRFPSAKIIMTSFSFSGKPLMVLVKIAFISFSTVISKGLGLSGLDKLSFKQSSCSSGSG